MGGDLQERSRGPFGIRAALLPIAQSRSTDADEVRELRLRDM